jgi:hypothetical protein
MNHPCGCQSAEQCWRGCCCLTVEERWAWAREHNIEPPPYAERPAPKKPAAPKSKSWNSPRQRDQAEAPAPAAPHCAECARRAAAQPRPCCAREPTSAPAPAEGLRWVGGSAALGCRGHATTWIASGAVTVPPAALAWQPLAPPAEWLSSAPENPDGLSLIPPDPPPRCTHC